jgi:protein-tyrosine phosphatase
MSLLRPCSYTIKPFMPPFHIILSHLYIGNIDSLKSSSLFRYIVNCTRHIPSIPTIETTRIAIHDDYNESATLLKEIESTHVLERIHSSRMKGQNVLVHCHAGMQRSCAVVAMYLIKYHCMSPEEVFRFLPTKRPIAFLPEPTFRKAIYDFYKKNKTS